MVEDAISQLGLVLKLLEYMNQDIKDENLKWELVPNYKYHSTTDVEYVNLDKPRYWNGKIVRDTPVTSLGSRISIDQFTFKLEDECKRLLKVIYRNPSSMQLVEYWGFPRVRNEYELKIFLNLNGISVD